MFVLTFYSLLVTFLVITFRTVGVLAEYDLQEYNFYLSVRNTMYYWVIHLCGVRSVSHHHECVTADQDLAHS